MDENSVNEAQAEATEAQQADETQEEAKSAIDWKAEARKWEKLAKKSRNAEAELEKFKQTSAEELEKYKQEAAGEIAEATARAERAESRAAQLQLEADRQTAIKEISVTENVPAELLEMFQTSEEMETFAAKYKEAGRDTKIHAVAPSYFGGGSGSRIVRDANENRTPKDAFVEVMQQRLGRI